MQYFLNSEGSGIIKVVITSIKSNRDYLSMIDGEIGDGDHGVNMSKGFSIAEDQISDTHSFSDASKILGDVLMMEIGGSMGPLYGSMFKSFFRETREKEKITSVIFLKMLESSLNRVKELGKAEVGDKTMIDTLSPAVIALKKAVDRNDDFHSALIYSLECAKEGRDSTKEMIARIGRSARLGDRSKGVLDAGAASCYIILDSLYTSIIKVLLSE